MDVSSSTQSGSAALLYPTLTRNRGHIPQPQVNRESPSSAQQNEALRSAYETLRTRLAESGIALSDKTDKNTFTPERVADRILDFVSNNVNRAAPEDKQQVLDRSRQAIEKGFSQARDVLQSLGVLKGDIAANIDDTYDRVMTGLDELAGNAPVASSASKSAVLATGVGQSRSSAVRIETQEGDVVTINFSSVSAQSKITAAAQTQNGSVYGYASASYQSSQLSYSVEGDLNEEEQAAIDQLLKRTDKISEQFFSGNVQAAFQQASQLNISGEQIASYSLALEKRSVYTAVSQYQETQSSTSVPNGNQALADYANQVRELMSEPSAQMFADPGATVAQLVENSVSVRAPEDFVNSLQQGALGLLRDLMGVLVQGTPPVTVTTTTPVATEAAAPAAVAAPAVDVQTAAENALQVA